jgi:cation transport regulator ChaC
MHTVAHLEERGIRDPYLWKLQHMVAQRILTLAQENPDALDARGLAGERK